MKLKKLNNNEKIPFISYGVYEIKPKKTKKAVLNALNVGYTSIDNAQVYYNEKEVGNAIKESGIPREELYLTSKNWVSNSGYEKTIKAVNKTLQDLQDNYKETELSINDCLGDTDANINIKCEKSKVVVSGGLGESYTWEEGNNAPVFKFSIDTTSEFLSNLYNALKENVLM